MKILVRFLLYFLGASVLTGAAALLLYCFGYRLVLRENAVIEWLEALWLVLSGLLLFLASRNSSWYPRLFGILWLLALTGAIRELDAVFDDIFFHGAWFFPAVFLMLLAGYRILKSGDVLKREIFEFAQTQQAVFLGLGFFTVVVFAQIFGQQAVMRAIFNEHYVRCIGGFLEEIIEFLGYIILVVGSLECCLSGRRLSQEKERADS